MSVKKQRSYKDERKSKENAFAKAMENLMDRWKGGRSEGRKKREGRHKRAVANRMNVVRRGRWIARPAQPAQQARTARVGSKKSALTSPVVSWKAKRESGKRRTSVGTKKGAPSAIKKTGARYAGKKNKVAYTKPGSKFQK